MNYDYVLIHPFIPWGSLQTHCGVSTVESAQCTAMNKSGLMCSSILLYPMLTLLLWTQGVSHSFWEHSVFPVCMSYTQDRGQGGSHTTSGSYCPSPVASHLKRSLLTLCGINKWMVRHDLPNDKETIPMFLDVTSTCANDSANPYLLLLKDWLRWPKVSVDRNWGLRPPRSTRPSAVNPRACVFLWWSRWTLAALQKRGPNKEVFS